MKHPSTNRNRKSGLLIRPLTAARRAARFVSPHKQRTVFLQFNSSNSPERESAIIHSAAESQAAAATTATTRTRSAARCTATRKGDAALSLRQAEVAQHSETIQYAAACCEKLGEWIGSCDLKTMQSSLHSFDVCMRSVAQQAGNWEGRVH